MQVRENFNMAKSIMIQGTMSNVGKSLLAGGLCRVLKEDGIKVAPFKSQNMALNSFITADGLEMGRAQVMQAEAAMIRPEVYMNPILLKPTSDVGSQVIVNGEVAGVMPAMEYFRKKKEYIPAILEAYHKHHPKAIGLSALMTTTVVSMEETITLLKQEENMCPIFVGGAVLTEDIAQDIHADYYTKDAMSAVNLLNEIIK